MSSEQIYALVLTHSQASNKLPAPVNRAQAAIKSIATATIPRRPGKRGTLSRPQRELLRRQRLAHLLQRKRRRLDALLLYFYDARGYTERFHFDTTNRLASQWDGQRASVISTLRTDHVYDSFDRLVAQRRTDAASQAVQTQGFEWSQFDQRTSFTDALNYRVLSSYDANGNQLSETDALGNTERFSYNAENRLLQRTDRLQSATTTVYDAYGQRLFETDANGRVTSYSIGAFGQILGSSTGFSSGYGALGGAASSSQTMRYDWQGRLAQEQPTSIAPR